MDRYESNSQCILDYLALFQTLSSEEADAEQCLQMWHTILEREQSSDGVQLAPSFLRQQFRLEERDFLLAMAALALEMDGGLRNAFRRKYALALPTIEYGLQLISPLYPSRCETLAELAGDTMLCALLLTTAELTAYPLERPLILCRTVLAFLTGLSMAEIPGCTPLMTDETQWLPLHERELAQVEAWYALGTENTLYLCAPAGSGRKTLFRRAYGHVVWAKPDELSPFSTLDQDHALREMAALVTLLDAPICAAPDPDRSVFRQLERICRQYGIPLAALVEEDQASEDAKEVVRLPRQLSAEQRWEVWATLVPQSEPDTAPKGAMTIGAMLETAVLALRTSAVNKRQSVTMEDTRQAMLQRGGALEFGVRYQTDVTLEDMVLSGNVREQLELICQAALCGDKLVSWGLPRQREGVTAVFHGPSGTGKTMAASAIANRLGMPLLRADLSQIMDKYVGETEKHLGRLFRSARENHCVLLFDEADSLFGKRAQVSSGHDKYANLSTSYLLQEIEQYDGIAILSTNLLSNFDEAFLRRLQYIVRFALPDAALRETLWRQALPPERCAEVLPYAQLAQAELSPARILAVVRGAVVQTLGNSRETVDLAGIITALSLELEKGNKSLPKPLAELCKPGKAGIAMESKLQQQMMQQDQVNKPNLTGIPTQMKFDFAQRSGLSFDGVRVHYNLDKPARLQALAYTQGTQVYVRPGQERHLKHELGHVVQQKLGMVSTNILYYGHTSANINPQLEQQADELSKVSIDDQKRNISSPIGTHRPIIQFALDDYLTDNGQKLLISFHCFPK